MITNTNYKTDICYVVSHGFAARMVMQTNLLKKLVEQGYKVCLISPDAKDAALTEYCANNSINLVEFQPKIAWSEDYLNARKYFLEDIKGNPALWEKHLRAIHNNPSRHPWKRARPYILYAANRLVRQIPVLRNWFKSAEDRYLLSDETQDFLKKLAPRLVVSTYPVNINEALLLRNAQVLNIKTIIHLLSWDNITCKGIFPATADNYIAWGGIMASEFEQYYSATSENVAQCGVPHFDEHFRMKTEGKDEYKPYLTDFGLNPDRPYLFVAMSAPYFAPNEIDIVEWLAAKVNTNYFGENMQFVVRPHPQNVTGSMADETWLPRLRALKNERVAVDFPNLVKSKLPWSMEQKDMIRFSSLISGATVVINSGSTASIDALMLGRPVILSSFDADFEHIYWKQVARVLEFPHYKKIIALGGIRVARNFQDFEQYIRLYIENPDADLEQREHTRFAQCGINDGKATERVVSALTQILSKN